MKKIRENWKIEVSQHMKTLFSTEVPCTILSEKTVVNLARTLIAKYALSDEEIVNQFINKSSNRSSDICKVIRTQSHINQFLTTSYSVQVADICVDIKLKIFI